MSFQKHINKCDIRVMIFLNIINYVYSHYDSIKYDYIP